MKFHAGTLNHLGMHAKKIMARTHLRSHGLTRLARPLHPGLAFVQALLRNPRAVGACSPSSKALSMLMAAQVPLPTKGLVVELGGGTGAVTSALLRRGVPASRLCVVEHSSVLARLLAERFPGVNVIHGDAAQLTRLLPGPNPRVHCVVSSLPLLSLPSSLVARIIEQIELLLARRGTLIQFTYRIGGGASPLAAAFEPVRSQTILFNLPPAKVEVFHPRRPSSPRTA